MVRIRSFARGAWVTAILMSAIASRSDAQRGVLTAALTGPSTTATSDTLTLRIAVQMTPGWHIGAVRPGVTGVPTTLSWRLPAGWRVVASRWPAPASAVVGRDTVFEYRGPFTIETTLVRAGSRAPGTAQATLSYGICKDVCMPGRVTLTYDVR
jgi:thiol:disulfide interchange protein DsbD